MIQLIDDVSVIICAYTEERWDDLVAAVESVKQQTMPCKEIIVVIDHNPNLLRRAQEHMSGVIIVENTQERGLRGARNCGIACTRSQIIAFLDDDAVAIPEWLSLLTEGYDDSRVLGTGGAITPSWVSNKPDWLPEEFYWIVGCTYRGMPQADAVIRNPIGANMSFRREIFETVGDFHSDAESVGTQHAGGCEETELCIRAHHYWPDRVFLYHPLANVFHRVPKSRVRWQYFRFRCYVEGLAKASVSRYVGQKDGLASERSYTLLVLPQGVLRGLLDGIVHHDFMGLARAGAIVAGLMVTAAGYAVGYASLQVAKSKQRFFKKNERLSNNLETV